MTISTGSFPLALPGGAVARKPAKPKAPLLRTALAFGAKPISEVAKRGKKPFRSRGMGQRPLAFGP